MNILENIQIILEEIKDHHSYNEYIKYNKFKKKLISQGVIRIGGEKLFYGPGEEKPKPKPPMIVLPPSTNPEISKPKQVKQNTNTQLQSDIPSGNDGEDEIKTNSNPKITTGMKNAMSGVYSCLNCGFSFPKYKGRYPSKCPNCGKDLDTVGIVK